MPYSFPQGFVWGTATAAHQVEGNNVASDFWMLEHAPGTLFREPSGDAVDHFHRYPQDIALVKQLGFGAYRFSVEWARIEPEGQMWRSRSFSMERPNSAILAFRRSPTSLVAASSAGSVPPARDPRNVDLPSGSRGASR